MNLIDRVRTAATSDCRLGPDAPLVMGVSGGPDSLTLLDGLARLGFNLYVAHFDHQLRPESGEDADAVERMAVERGLPFRLGGGNVTAYVRETHRSVEEAARELRYRFLFEYARETGAQAVAVAHTADDQVETLLMHLLRGAGLSGLKGMTAFSLPNPWDADIPLVRPLLGVWRRDVEEYCRAEELRPLQDASNLTDAFFRNRLRNRLVPELEKYNPRVKEALLRTADALAGDWEVLENVAWLVWQSALVEAQAGQCTLDRQVLANQPLGIRRSLIRRMALTARPELRDLDFNTVARAVDFIDHPTRSRKLELTQGLSLVWHADRLTMVMGDALPLIDPDWPQLPDGQEKGLAPGGSVILKNGWRLRCEAEPAPQDIRLAPPSQAWLDRDGLAFPLCIRSAQEGERFEPLGMDGRSKKLSDFWIDAGVPKAARARWPLVCSGERAAWVVGQRVAEWARVKEGGEMAIHLWVERG